MLLDIIFLAIIIICTVWGAKRGIIKTALGLSSVLVSIIAAIWLYEPFMELIKQNAAISGAIDNFKESIKTALLPAIKIDEALIDTHTPALLVSLLGSDIISQGQEAVATAVADAVVYLITIVIFIVVIKVLVSILFKVFNLAAKLPVIKQANGLVGGILGIVIGVFLCWIAAAALTMFIGQEGSGWIIENVETSRLAKHLFDTNIIFSTLK
ncbi:MAG: CvpA family protein [Clostridia bacterium]|nr:CvpA family protein [Clostridia bacterium]